MASGQPGAARSPAARARFVRHAITFALVNLLLFAVDLLTGGGWWFFWPLFGWGIGLAIQAVSVFGPGATTGAENSGQRPRPPDAVTAPVSATNDPAERLRLVEDGERRVARLWRVARRVENQSVREQAFRICAAADRVAEALAGGVADTATAQAFLDRYLAPTEAVLERYVALSGRGVAGAAATLRQVETEDLPAIETRLTDLYARLHRGDLIDLQVAREMLELDMDAPAPRPAPKLVP